VVTAPPSPCDQEDPRFAFTDSGVASTAVVQAVWASLAALCGLAAVAGVAYATGGCWSS
jgi:hypothetical protein